MVIHPFTVRLGDLDTVKSALLQIVPGKNSPVKSKSGFAHFTKSAYFWPNLLILVNFTFAGLSRRSNIRQRTRSRFELVKSSTSLKNVVGS